ncbi:MAG TPA: MBL fold metallo-hydrolase, partial [Rubrobacter sp.]|nr:MBL fold metallo-hydrolase [Rubrobacter sp.]
MPRRSRFILGFPCVRLLAAVLLVLVLPPAAACRGFGPSGGADPPPSGSLSVSFIDVGQGDGVLVQAGGEGYLIDAGRVEEGPDIVDFLRDRGVRTLDGIVVSNPDADHIGGFLDVFDAFPVETVYLSGDPKGTLTYDTFLRAARDEGSDLEVVRAGMQMDWGGVQADTWVPKHPAGGVTVSRHSGKGTEDRVGAGLAVTQHVTAWKVCSRNFACGGFSEVGLPLYGVLGRAHAQEDPPAPHSRRSAAYQTTSWS